MCAIVVQCTIAISVYATSPVKWYVVDGLHLGTECFTPIRILHSKAEV